MARLQKGACVVLLGAALLLCSAEQSESNRQPIRDARKLRYEDHQEKVEPAGEDAPLSLLPEDASPQLSAEPASGPNELPVPGELSGGVTARNELKEPEQPARTDNSFTATVRSVTRFGGTYGDPGGVPQSSQAVPAGEELVATNTAHVDATPQMSQKRPLPSLRNGFAIPGGSGEQMPSSSKPGNLIASATAPKEKPAAPAITDIPAEKLIPAPTKAVPAAGVQTKTQAVPEKNTGLAPALERSGLADRLRAEINRDLERAQANAAAATSMPVAGADQPTGSAAKDELKLPEAHDHPFLGSMLSSEPEQISSSLHADARPLDSEPLPDADAALGIPGQGAGNQPRSISLTARIMLGIGGIFALGLVAVSIPKPRRRRAGDQFEVLETIALEDGRRLTIVEKRHYALILGMTRQSTHLLEKVSMNRLSSDYRSVVDEIIRRESDSPIELWRLRPLFTSLIEPQYASAAAGSPVTRTSLSELRSQLEVIGGSSSSQTRTEPISTSSRRQQMQRSSEPEVLTSSVTRQNRGSLAIEREMVKSRLREQARGHRLAS